MSKFAAAMVCGGVEILAVNHAQVEPARQTMQITIPTKEGISSRRML